MDEDKNYMFAEFENKHHLFSEQFTVEHGLGLKNKAIR